MINKWKNKIGLNKWNIATVQISKWQVIYPDDIAPEEKYFIGVTRMGNNNAVIFHDVDLYEEAIVHELLHLKFPNKSEDWINKKTKELLK